MEKIIKRAFAILVIFVIITVSVIAVTAYAFKSRILNSDIRTIDQNILFIHTIDKGEDLEIPLGWNSYKLADDTYFVDIVLNNGHGNPNYSIKNAVLVINLDEKVNILTSFYSDKGLDYTHPIINFQDDQKKVECRSENGYMHLQMLLSGVQAESLNIDLIYAVAGKGIYSFNKFPQTWEGLELELNYFE